MHFLGIVMFSSLSVRGLIVSVPSLCFVVLHVLPAPRVVLRVSGVRTNDPGCGACKKAKTSCPHRTAVEDASVEVVGVAATLEELGISKREVVTRKNPR